MAVTSPDVEQPAATVGTASVGFRWRRAIVTFGLLWAIAATWSLGLPRFAAPDEPAHVQKAAGVVRDGPGTGRPVEGQPPKVRLVTVPAAYVATHPLCYAFRPAQPASCQPFPPAHGETVTGTTAGQYPPLYYVLVGWPSLLIDSYAGIWLLRLVSAGLCAAALTLAFTLVERSRDAVAVVGVLLAASPMVVFLAGVVNPNSLEIAAALATWVGALVLLRPGSVGVDRAVLWLTAAAAVVLVGTRLLTPLWVVVIVVAAGVVGGRSRVRAVLSDRHGRFALAVVAAAVVVQLAWIVGSGLASVDDPAYALDEPISDTTRTVLGRQLSWLEQMVGNFGWLDTPAPLLTVLVWVLLTGGLAVLGALVAPKRVALVLGGLITLAVTLPVLFELRSAPSSGLVWQGRYLLPIAVGVPLVAGFAVARSPFAGLLRTPRARALVGGGVLIAQVAAFYWALRRYSVGQEGGILIWRAPAWSPPGGILMALMASAVLWGLFVWWILWRAPTLESNSVSGREE
jgi:hypothetical protein